MVVINCNQPTYWDVDDTLVKWSSTPEEKKKYGIEISYPIMNKHFTDLIVPHRKHVEQLKKHKLRGHTIIVWSAGGTEWAHAAVKALDITDFVDLIIEKPQWMYDDKQAVDFMPKADYLKDE